MCGVVLSAIRQGGAVESIHQPHHPFGCTVEWGAELGYLSIFPDSRTHICDRETEHNGRHRCRCGATLIRQVKEPIGG